jgi:P-type Mg2+ transporter
VTLHLRVPWSKADAPLVTRVAAPATEILRLSHEARDALFAELGTCADGLTQAEADAHLLRVGPNDIAQSKHKGIGVEIYFRLRTPLNALLLSLAVVSWLTGDARAAVVIAVMVLLSVTLGFVQEHRSNRAAEALRAMVRTTASVYRRGEPDTIEVPIETLVPGDLVRLSAGDLVPGDLRLLTSKDLHVNQSALTGEAMPAEKLENASPDTTGDPFDQRNICFMGSNVLSGTATGVILQTGVRTYFGRIASSVAGTRAPTSFDRGITRFTWLMIRFIVVMVPAVFLINGFTKGDWLEALLFAVAVAVGLTPEMLPMIVTMNLAKGAMAMARKKVIVKRLNSIQNFGAMDVLCTDKTGTLTQNHIILQYHRDIEGKDSDRVLQFAWLNSHFQSGLKNLMDEAVLTYAKRPGAPTVFSGQTKVDELPFDFHRRCMSVVVDPGDGTHLLITKGAVEEIFAICDEYWLERAGGKLDAGHLARAKQEAERLNGEGFRVVAVAYKVITAPKAAYSTADEKGLTLLGTIAFLDPPKEGVAAAIAALNRAGVAVKILTGDNDLITRTICRQVGLPVERIVLGGEVEKMDDAALDDAAGHATVFAKVSPEQKARVIDALQRRGHVVGYLGDGINDGPALKTADVGVSVDTAVDIAKESADIILLEKSLSVLEDGVIEGRKIFGNITKYIKMGASSNFGNMFSVLGGSIFLPFLPMAPIQVLTNNLLYDFSQTTIPTDNVDPDYLATPHKWDIGNLTKFVLVIGPISSIFDYATFFMMLYVFDCWNNPALFQAGWFVESLLTQTLIIHIIRTARIPFFQSRASLPLIFTTIAICTIGGVIPYTPLGTTLGFVPLPPLYWVLVMVMMATYAALTHLVKSWFVRRWGM